MRPVLTPKQMRVLDAEAVIDGTSMDTLIARAGAAVARAAKRMMGGLYGRTVVVVTGRGNNGADGRVTGRLLADQGVRVIVLDADRMPPRLPVCDLIIDAAYGTGFRGDWNPRRATASRCWPSTCPVVSMVSLACRHPVRGGPIAP